jgi:N4-(beta-N-acetylglucosaminyl)-L-asparaginase
MTPLDRRELLVAGTAAALLARSARADPPAEPVAVSSANGLRAVDVACRRAAAGDRPVHAAVQGVGVNEADPEDASVGYGGLPNEEGVVELDACCMDGTLGLGGSVGGLRNIMHPSQVALKVMDRTDHVMLVGHGAYRFARAHGFPHQDLLTEKARKRWLSWKENLSDKDDWVPEREKGGTISCLVRASDGRLGGCTTTSGLAFKIPGRLGDSPILGAGLYADDTAGAAGATGRGEAVILTAGSFLAVEAMRRGASAEEAALEVCKRIAARTKDARLLGARGRPRFQVKIYCLRADGDHGAASIWSGGEYAVRDGEGTRKRPAAYLYERAKPAGTK